MYYNKEYQGPYFMKRPWNNPVVMYNVYKIYPNPYYDDKPMYNSNFSNQFIHYNNKAEYDSKSNFLQYTNTDVMNGFKDYGPEPFVVDIEEATLENNNYRTTLWTGNYMQLTLMSINVGEEIGLEVHPDLDQFLRIEEGQGIVLMGDKKDNLDFQENVYDDFAFIIPAGKWHNLINIGNEPLKLYSIYAPPQHPHSTVHKTRADANASEEVHGHWLL